MPASLLDAIVIGAGHAGLSISHYLKELRMEHLVLERKTIGDSWISQRWDSFTLNTPNWANHLPGLENSFPDRDGFCTGKEFVSYLRHYSEKLQLPVVENCPVTSVEQDNGSGIFRVSVLKNGSEKTYRSKKVIVASGGQNRMNLPPISANLSRSLHQLHAAEYRNGALLPEGDVLIAGGAQSGLQIAEDLIGSGRKVYLSTSKVPRVPRRYRGKDIVEWLILTGFWDMKTADVTDPAILSTRQAQISGIGPQGHTLSLQSLALKGATILGKIKHIETNTVYLEDNAAEHIRCADEASRKMKEIIDAFIRHSGTRATEPETDSADLPDENATCASHDTALNLAETHITSVIWATGFTGDFGFLKLPVLSAPGTPRHTEGLSEIRGLSFVGLPWLRKRKSGIILGIRDDAEFILEKTVRNRTVWTPG